MQGLLRLQRANTAIEKLRTLLMAVSKIHQVAEAGLGETTVLSADDFLPLFIFVLVQTVRQEKPPRSLFLPPSPFPFSSSRFIFADEGETYT